MANPIRRVVFSTLTAVLMAASAFAQKAPPKSVTDGYDKGVAAVKAGKYAEAIPLLDAAIKADPTPRSYKEGVFSGDYYPQAYLFAAYMLSGDTAKATALSTNRMGVPQKVAGDIAKANTEFMKMQGAAAAKANFDQFMKSGDTEL